MTGYSGGADFDAAILPAAHWKVGSFAATLRDMPAIVKTAPNMKHSYARMGLDLLAQAREVTIDFRRMRLTLE